MASGSVSGWGEGIILSFAIVALITIIVSGYNYDYNKNYDLGLGDISNSSFANIQEKTVIAQNDTLNGEVGLTGQGLQPLNSLGVLRDFMKIIWDFLNGRWISNIGEMIGNEAIIVLLNYLRVLWIISIIFAFLYTIFKVVT